MASLNFKALIATGLLLAALALGVKLLTAAPPSRVYLSVTPHPAKLARYQSGGLWHAQFHHRATTLERHTRQYHFNGSAARHQRYITWQPGLLSVGTDDTHTNVFKGFFAETKTKFPSGSYFQTQMDPYAVSTNGQKTAESLIAVQTGNTDQTGVINYVLVSLSQHDNKAFLQIGYANGLIRSAKTVILKTIDSSKIMSEVRHFPITVTTDGVHTFAVWLGDRLLYQSRTLPNMHITPPFQVYLEVQALDLRYSARFRNLFIQKSDYLTITGLPPHATVSVGSANGYQFQPVVARAGVARLRLPLSHMWQHATVLVAARHAHYVFKHVQAYGGDRYAFATPGPAWTMAWRWLRNTMGTL